MAKSPGAQWGEYIPLSKKGEISSIPVGKDDKQASFVKSNTFGVKSSV